MAVMISPSWAPLPAKPLSSLMAVIRRPRGVPVIWAMVELTSMHIIPSRVRPLIYPPESSSLIMGWALLTGMANPMPSYPSVMILEELMPTTWPYMFTSGPPELPGLMAASVWI